MKVFKSKIATLVYDEPESILFVEILNESEMTPENLANHCKVVLEITGGKKHAAVVDVNFLFYTDMDGVQFAAKSEAYDNRSAIAFYGGPLSNRLNVHMLKMQNCIKFPVQFFLCKEEALAWVRQVVKREKSA